MAEKDSDSQSFEEWRTEHARNPENKNTPYSEAADRAGTRLLEEGLGKAALSVLREETTNTVSDSLTFKDEIVRDLGAAVYEEVDEESIPSRFVVHQQLLDKGAVVPGELAAEFVGEVRCQRVVEQVGKDRIEQLASSTGMI